MNKFKFESRVLIEQEGFFNKAAAIVINERLDHPNWRHEYLVQLVDNSNIYPPVQIWVSAYNIKLAPIYVPAGMYNE